MHPTLTPPVENELTQFVRLAMAVCTRRLEPHASPFSKKTYTQRQLMCCLLLRAYLNTTYRGVVRQLELMPRLLELMGLDQTPRFTTLAEFAGRVATPAVLESINDELLLLLGEAGVELTGDAAMDSTGLAATGPPRTTSAAAAAVPART